MSNDELLQHIVSTPDVMVGKPVIEGTRLTVEFIVKLLAHGSTPEEILEEYRGLHPDESEPACFSLLSRSPVPAFCR